MKLIIYISVVFLGYSSARKCGPVDEKCLDVDRNGNCRKIPFCPAKMKRKRTEHGCCCVTKDSLKDVNEVIDPLDVKKKKILRKTLTEIDKLNSEVMEIIEKKSEIFGSENFTKSHEKSKIYSKINSLSAAISDSMKSGIIELSVLIGVESEMVFRSIFGDEAARENEKVNLILKEAEEIYEHGNEVIEKLSIKFVDKN